MIEFGALPPGEHIEISASSFIAFGECRHKAAQRFVGIYGPDSLPAFRGGLAHQVFARHLRNGPIEPDEFEHACREEIGAKHLNMKIASLNLKPSRIRAVIEEVGALYVRFRSYPHVGFRGAEVALHADIGADVALVGSVDAVFERDGVVRLVDWKTGDLGDPLVQLRFYALLWLLDRGEAPDLVEAFSVKTGEQRSEPPTRSGMQAVADRVVEMVTELRGAWRTGDELERRAGPWCRYCPVLDDCPEGASAMAVLDADGGRRPTVTVERVSSVGSDEP